MRNKAVNPAKTTVVRGKQNETQLIPVTDLCTTDRDDAFFPAKLHKVPSVSRRLNVRQGQTGSACIHARLYQLLC